MKEIRNTLFCLLCIGVLLSCSEDDDPIINNPTDPNDPDPVTEVTVTATGFSIDLVENPVKATVLGTVSASASDGSEVSYAISSESVIGAVAINSSGEVSVADSSLFDFEKNQVITLEIAATSGEGSAKASIEINIQDLVLEADNGLLAYFPFNGNTNDESGKSRHANSYDVVLTKDRSGNLNSAASFSDAALTVPSLPSSDSFSFAAWIWDNGDETTTYRTLFSKVDVNGFVGVNFRFSKVGVQSYEHGGLNAFFNNSGSNGLDSKTRPLSSKKWIHVILTFDNTTSETNGVGTAIIYENGVSVSEKENVQFTSLDGLIGIGAQARPAVEEDIKIGAERVTGDDPSFSSKFAGSMDEIAFFDRALTVAEVKILSVD